MPGCLADVLQLPVLPPDGRHDAGTPGHAEQHAQHEYEHALHGLTLQAGTVQLRYVTHRENLRDKIRKRRRQKQLKRERLVR